MNDKSIDDVYLSLSKIVNSTYGALADKVLVVTNNNVVLFNKYAIQRIPTGYRVASKMTFTVLEFSSSRSALVWAILDHHSRSNDAQRVIYLDSKISSMDIETSIHKRIKIGAEWERASILDSKINVDNAKRAVLLVELNRLVLSAKKIMERDMQKT